MLPLGVTKVKNVESQQKRALIIFTANKTINSYIPLYYSKVLPLLPLANSHHRNFCSISVSPYGHRAFLYFSLFTQFVSLSFSLLQNLLHNSFFLLVLYSALLSCIL